MTRFIGMAFLAAAALFLTAALPPILSTAQDQPRPVRPSGLTSRNLAPAQRTSSFLDLPLVNGDFETPPYNTPATVTGWVVEGNVVVAGEGATSGTNGAVFNGGEN